MPPVVYNWSLGVQRDIGWQLVADVAYVGNAARDQLINRADQRPALRLRLPAVEPGSDQRHRADSAQPLPDDLLRPYRGYGAITQREFTGYSRLPLDAVLGEPPPLVGRPVGRRVLHLPDGRTRP